MGIKSLLTIAVLAVLAGCSKIELAGVSATKYLNVPDDCSMIFVHGQISVHLSASSDVMELVSDANVLPYVNVRKEGNTLVFEYEDGAKLPSSPFVTEIVIPVPAELDVVRVLDGAGFTADCDISVPGSLKLEGLSGSSFRFGGLSTPSLVLNLSGGSGFMSGNVEVESMSLNLSENSDVTMDGSVAECSATMNDSSDLAPATSGAADGEFSLSIPDFRCSLSNSCSASFHSDGTISGTLKNRCSISYTGGAAHDMLKLLDGSEIHNLQ